MKETHRSDRMRAAEGLGMGYLNSGGSFQSRCYAANEEGKVVQRNIIILIRTGFGIYCMYREY